MKQTTNHLKQILFVFSIVIIVCLISISISSCGENRDGTYQLSLVLDGNGKDYTQEYYKECGPATCIVKGNTAEIKIFDEIHHFTIDWNTMTYKYDNYDTKEPLSYADGYITIYNANDYTLQYKKVK
ncbi:hypothetical protein [uncultured Ruminococcus sp.]|uniref:hypothetical protein n=1 Tax=uncultured Ruminococcus sp. TaxID=165186 RepID=UPI00292EC9AD|nr:hypothetical protein [uncultured Ruminococcus sp.]